MNEPIHTIFVFTQNLKLQSFNEYKNFGTEANVFITTHLLFDNERNYISSLFTNCIFKTFADFLTDEEMAECDIQAFYPRTKLHDAYINRIKKLKNKVVIKKVLEKYNSDKKGKYILSNDLGLDVAEWHKAGFKFIKGSYYHDEKQNHTLLTAIKNKLASYSILRSLYQFIKKRHNLYNPEEVYIAYYENRKYVFLGKMDRIGYRLNIQFSHSTDECEKLNKGCYDTKESCTYMTTWHEQGKCRVPDEPKYSVRWAQDGYLPPNYSHCDYYFKPSNVIYYCWDILGTQLFKNQNLPYEIIPFRKRLYLPEPFFPKAIKNVLIVASGSGDWTALKNRSDDDLMVEAFVHMAKRFPEIKFTYRCHPTWVHPCNVGVNAINRVNDYFESLGLHNLILSSNIPIANTGKTFQLSFARSSLEEDLKNTDFVFGEHSISMIDAAFKGIPFSSVNLTRRRNFFIGINELGFPTCSSHEDIETVIKNITSEEFQVNYLKAVDKYNKMTDE